jgi:hypothetical protein
MPGNQGLSGGNRMKLCPAQWKRFTTAVIAAVSVCLVMPVHSAEDAVNDSPDQAGAESAAEPAENANRAEDDAGNDVESAENTGGAQAEEADQEQANEGSALKGITWEKRLADVDADDSGAAEWTELSAAYQTQLQNADWGRQEALDKFDRNDDGRLDETEYFFFMSALAQDLKPAQAVANRQEQAQQQEQDQEVAQQ